ncbi:MAG: MFS transporter [Gammaproteobacteria bacterium]
MVEQTYNPDKKKWLIPWVVAIAMFMETLDSTIVGVAIPRIADSFSINPVDLKLALTSYLLSLAVFIPISGWLADKYGEKKIFILALSVFTLSSLLCGTATNLLFLIIARLIQGFGGALMVPVGRLMLMRVFTKQEMVRAIAIMVVPGLVGPALGPTIGGLILQVASWHWIFLVNIPFGIMGIIVAYILLPKTPQLIDINPFNWLGFLLFSAGLTLLTAAMAVLGDNFSLVKYALLLAAVSAVFLFLYGWVSARQRSPLLDLTLFKQKTFMVSMAVNFFARIAIGAVPFLIPLLLQLVWGRSALFSGVMFMFLALGMMSSRIVLNQKVLSLFSFKTFLLVSTLLLSFLSMNLCWFSQPTSSFLLAALLFIIGMLTTQVYMCFGILYRFELNATQYSQAASIASTIQQFSAGTGIAIAAVILHLLSKLMSWPLFSSEVFFWTFIMINCFGFISVIFVGQLDPGLRFEEEGSK